MIEEFKTMKLVIENNGIQAVELPPSQTLHKVIITPGQEIISRRVSFDYPGNKTIRTLSEMRLLYFNEN